MQTARSSRWFRLTLFGLLYLAQGTAWAYLSSFQEPYLNGMGVDADTIGLLAAILLLPFIVRIFIGLPSDPVNLAGRGQCILTVRVDSLP